MKNKVIVICGPTASGKTNIAVDLAYKFGGEVVSADSRQVYKYMDIGSGKDLAEYELTVKGKQSTVKIPYRLINVVAPTEEYDLSRFLADAKLAIDDIIARNKVPIVAGGTHLWAQALVDGYDLARVKPNLALRTSLEAKSKTEVQAELRKINIKFYDELNNSEQNNTRRLIRYIEILKSGGEVAQKKVPDYDFLVIALKWSKEDLEPRIYKRIIQRLENENMIAEVEKLHYDHLVTWPRLIKFGLEYKYCALYLRGELGYDIMVSELFKETKKFVKRQNSWLKRWKKQGQAILFSNKRTDIKRAVKEFLE